MDARKTKSGKWHAQATYKDSTGAWKKKSFTAPTRREAIRLAEDFERDCSSLEDGRLADMVERYIKVHEAVLAVSTITGYRKELRCHIRNHKIGTVKLSALTDAKLQEWIGDLSKKISVKSVKNAYGLVSAVVRHYQPGRTFNVRFAQEAAKDIYVPTKDDLRVVVALADPEMQKAIRIAMYCGLRQGEIAALTAADIDREKGFIRVNKAQARTADGGHVIKPPKTPRSIRSVPAPQFLLQQLPKRGKVVDLNVDEISWHWQKLIKRSGLRHFNFHALRKFSASMAVQMGCGMETVKAMHGWSNSYTALEHYIRPLEDELKKDTEKLLAAYSASQI